MMNLSELNANQLDFFTELQNIGASHAATSLSTMLNESIKLKVPRVHFCEFDHISDILGGAETLVVGLLVAISGDIDGFILLIQNAEDANQLSKSISKAMGIETQDDDFFSEMQLSALQEVANILAGSFVTAIATLSGLVIDCSVPSTVIDMAGAIMNLPAIIYGDYGDIVLFLETEFQDNDKTMSGHFFLMPNVDSFDKLINKMRI